MKLCLSLLLFIRFTNICALETDQYMVWDRALDDSKEIIHRYLNNNMQDALIDINNTWNPKKKSCFDVQKAIVEKSTDGIIITNIESWALDEDTVIHRYPNPARYSRTEQYALSQYANSKPRLIDNYFFGVNYNYNNIYFGTDKLVHFVGTGWRLYKLFKKSLKKNRSIEQAELVGIKYGIKKEFRYYGLKTSSIFSFADIEANYQGLQFMKEFCYAKTPILKLVNKRWVATRKINIEQYVTPGWDESFNENYILSKRLKKINPSRKRYCSLIQSPRVRERMNYYKSIWKSNRSLEYIKARQALGKIPLPSKLSNFCK